MVWRTTAITITTCFLLGTTFTHWIADHNVLWRSPITPEALNDAISYYSLLSTAVPGLGYIYVAVGLLGVASAAGRTFKGVRSDRGEVLFDGGSLVLLAGIAYNQISSVYPTINLFSTLEPVHGKHDPRSPILSTAVRDLANDNVITAVMLTGVMLLQAGRYYAKRPSSSRPEAEATVPDPQSPPTEPTRRSGTPFRELTEEEAFELEALNEL